MPSTKPFQRTEHDESIISAARRFAIATLPAFDDLNLVEESSETKPVRIDATFITDLVGALTKRDEALLAHETSDTTVENPLQSGNFPGIEKPGEPIFPPSKEIKGIALKPNHQHVVLAATQLVVDKILEKTKTEEGSWEVSLPYGITLAHNHIDKRYFVQTNPVDPVVFVDDSLIKTIAYVVSVMT